MSSKLITGRTKHQREHLKEVGQLSGSPDKSLRGQICKMKRNREGERRTCTRTLLQSPALTSDLATQRAAYAADRSTLEKSFPEKAPPPCAPHPPYVSTMIFLPVKPASLCNAIGSWTQQWTDTHGIFMPVPANKQQNWIQTETLTVQLCEFMYLEKLFDKPKARIACSREMISTQSFAQGLFECPIGFQTTTIFIQEGTDLRSTDDEATGRLQMVHSILVEELVRNDNLDDFLHQVFAQLFGRHFFRVLHGDHNGVHTGRYTGALIQGVLAGHLQNGKPDAAFVVNVFSLAMVCWWTPFCGSAWHDTAFTRN